MLEPGFLIRGGAWNAELRQRIIGSARKPEESLGDFSAQVSANKAGLQRLQLLIEKLEDYSFGEAVDALNAYGETIARQMLAEIPDGDYRFSDLLDDDGIGDVVVGAFQQVVEGRVEGEARALAGGVLDHPQVGAEDGLDAGRQGRPVELDHREQVALVGQRDRRHLLPGELRHQRLDADGAVDQRVFGVQPEVDELRWFVLACFGFGMVGFGWCGQIVPLVILIAAGLQLPVRCTWKRLW